MVEIIRTTIAGSKIWYILLPNKRFAKTLAITILTFTYVPTTPSALLATYTTINTYFLVIIPFLDISILTLESLLRIGLVG